MVNHDISSVVLPTSGRSGDWTVDFQQPASPRYSEAGSLRAASDQAGVNFNLGDSRSDVGTPKSQCSEG